MNISTDALPPDSQTTETEPVKPVRRRRTVKAASEDVAATPPQGDATTDLEGVGSAPAEQATTKPPRRKRAAPGVPEVAPETAPSAAPVQDSTTAVVEVAAGASVGASVAASPAEAPPASESIASSDAHAVDSTVADEAGADAGDDRPERSRRRNRRERQRANRAAEGGTTASQDASPQAPTLAPQTAEQLGALFAHVVSGDFDVDEATAASASSADGALAESASAPVSGVGPDAPAASAAQPGPEAAAVEPTEGAAHKRVLAPEPDAPKLQKVLGQAGVGSRRDMEELIADGRVTVNGEPAHTGQRISWGDRIEVNGRPIKYRIAPPPARIIAYHKPVGEVVTHDDPQQRPTVFRNLPRLQHGKWQSVGRLDINTEGLLLFTTSGELANQLMHPRFGVEREYAVRVLGTLEPDARQRLLQGVMVEGQQASFKSIEDGGGEGANHWYRVVITEGRNREVRKLFDTVGLTVSRLIRIRYGSVVLPRGLKRGVWVDLGQDDVRLIRQLAGGARNGDRHNDGGTPHGGRGPQGSDRGPRPNDRGGRNDRGPRRDAPQAPATAQADRVERESDEGLDFDPMRIPNPLEQTFDRRFAKSQRSPFSGRAMAHGGGGFGAGGSAPDAEPKRGGGPKEPDPLQTSLGFIGGDAFHRKGGRSGGGFTGGNRGGPRGGGKGGQRGR